MIGEESMFEDDSLEVKIDMGNKNFVEYSISTFFDWKNIDEATLEMIVGKEEVEFSIYNDTKSGLSYEALECLALLIGMCTENNISFSMEKFTNDKRTIEIKIIITIEDFERLNNVK